MIGKIWTNSTFWASILEKYICFYILYRSHKDLDCHKNFISECYLWKQAQVKTSFWISRGVFETLAFPGFQTVFFDKKKRKYNFFILMWRGSLWALKGMFQIITFESWQVCFCSRCWLPVPNISLPEPALAPHHPLSLFSRILPKPSGSHSPTPSHLHTVYKKSCF